MKMKNIPSLSRNPSRRPTPHARLAEKHNLLVQRRFRKPEAIHEFSLVEKQRVRLRCYWDIDGRGDRVLVEFVRFADVDEELRGRGCFEDGEDLDALMLALCWGREVMAGNMRDARR